MIVGIDASRNRSGGAKGHLKGILNDGNPTSFGITEVHVWTYHSLAQGLPVKPWLHIHTPQELEEGLFKQIAWQYRKLPYSAQKAKCEIMLYTDAGTVGNFCPSVVMSRDMLSYEPGEMKRFGLSVSRLRLIALKYIQASSMKKADGVIFLTKYASSVIQKFTGSLKNTRIIPHGVSDKFRQKTLGGDWDHSYNIEIKCIYISNASMYKHQWNVVKAIALLRSNGVNIRLDLVGGGEGRAQKKITQVILENDPDSKFVKQHEFIDHDYIPTLIAKSDIYLFASSCENMPNTLVEGMASGLPIACSNRGPMPEVLKDGGEYFDPENIDSIIKALSKIIDHRDARIKMAARAKELSNLYSWERCANETYKYLKTVKQESDLGCSKQQSQ